MAKNKRRDSGNAFMVKDDLVQLKWSPTVVTAFQIDICAAFLLLG